MNDLHPFTALLTRDPEHDDDPPYKSRLMMITCDHDHLEDLLFFLFKAMRTAQNMESIQFEIPVNVEDGSEEDDTLHSATFQPDLCDQLTPATVCVWLRRQGTAALEQGETTKAQMLAMAAGTVEKLLDTPDNA